MTSVAPILLYRSPLQDSLVEVKDVVIIAEGIPQLLERIFQSQGLYYFDYPTFIPSLRNDSGRTQRYY